MTLKDLIKKLQTALNNNGENLAVDGDPGPKTLEALLHHDVEVTVKRKPESEPRPKVAEIPPWLKEARDDLGKKETDPAFNKEMSSKWKLVGLNLGTIKENWAAWCGLFVAACLSGAGFQYAKNGAGAANWGSFGQKIEWKRDGIPQGAIIHINHNGKCDSGSGNHVTFANGSCTAAEITKAGAYFAGLGGNQGNKVSISRYPASDICEVRWPNEEAKPAPVAQSKDCANANATGGSTK